jgi:four helix bundle protein
MGTVEEECDESIYWIEMLVDAGLIKCATVADLIDEGNQILSIVVASIKTARRGK